MRPGEVAGADEFIEAGGDDGEAGADDIEADFHG